MLYMLWKGFLIGILVAVPIGPVGLFCIQRTLYKGRWHGFYSGLGASLSDFFYAITSYASLGIVVHFIENNQSVLQFLSSFLLLSFGIYTLIKSPSEKFRKNIDAKPNSYPQEFLSVFLLSFSNPSIIFLFIGLYNSLRFVLPETRYFFKVIGLICILIGNIFWWFVVTYWIAKIQKNITIQNLLIINKIIGITIIVFSLGILFFSSFKNFTSSLSFLQI